MSTSRVYWKGARLVLSETRRYIARWQLQLQDNLTTEQYNCLTDVLTAITSCLALLPKNDPT